jgi:hypothetical protein
MKIYLHRQYGLVSGREMIFRYVTTIKTALIPMLPPTQQVVVVLISMVKQLKQEIYKNVATATPHPITPLWHTAEYIGCEPLKA